MHLTSIMFCSLWYCVYCVSLSTAYMVFATPIGFQLFWSYSLSFLYRRTVRDSLQASGVEPVIHISMNGWCMAGCRPVSGRSSSSSLGRLFGPGNFPIFSWKIRPLTKSGSCTCCSIDTCHMQVALPQFPVERVHLVYLTHSRYTPPVVHHFLRISYHLVCCCIQHACACFPSSRSPMVCLFVCCPFVG